MVILYILGLLLIFYILAKVCDQYFVNSLDTISKKLKLSEDVAGATFMAIGSSAPELFTSLIALSKVGSEDVGAGTIVGSAIFNILVIVGASAVAATAYLKWRPVIRDLLFYIVSIIVLLITFWDGVITLPETLIYLAGYAIYILILSQWSGWFPTKDEGQDEMEEISKEMEKGTEKEKKSKNLLVHLLYYVDDFIAFFFPNQRKEPQKYIRTFVMSIVFIIVSSYFLVELAVLTAHDLGVPQVIIALTVLAAGTSIPDLLSSVIVAKQGRGDMAVSNAVGSNTFDILIGLGLPWFIFVVARGESVVVGTENLMSSIFLLFFTVISLLTLLLIQKFRIAYKAGYLLLALYAGYLVYAIYTAYNPESFQIESMMRSAISNFL